MDHWNDVALDAQRIAHTTPHDTSVGAWALPRRLTSGPMPPSERGERLAVNREESIMPVSSKDRPLSTTRRSISLSEVERRVAALVRPFSLPLLRVSLGIVFIWFGALKVTNATPVADMVAGTVPWVDPAWFVPLLGTIEVVVGVALIAGRRLTAVSCILVAHLAGTFLVLLLQPQVAFQHGNPLLLTTEGEFVVKNLVLISAGIVLASRPRARRPSEKSRSTRQAESLPPATDA